MATADNALYGHSSARPINVSNGTLADVLPGHVDRELFKAYDAFGINSADDGCKNNDTEIVTKLSQHAKVLRCAASTARTNIRFVLSGDSQAALESELSESVDVTRENLCMARNILELIGAMKAFWLGPISRGVISPEHLSIESSRTNEIYSTVWYDARSLIRSRDVGRTQPNHEVELRGIPPCQGGYFPRLAEAGPPGPVIEIQAVWKR
ncbi:hypothetical protein AJ78_03651 [Emergomyces pasteurianus Ep9510]|uniref:Uncharacterized protein n=1 Tax=Emergomyces pasteurianus Ep9510 TaxID=1447872 RepID=A0A1J9PJT5_9EURO|nr:hypothetical protein AJ78_03651 [Emergomyces pasteurianus Ep9510]